LGFKQPELRDRRSTAEAAKLEMLENFRAASENPARKVRDAERLAIHKSRLARIAQREAVKKDGGG
jgi:hypothetical protein